VRTLVKICGITNWADAKAALDLGAEFLGFNFFPRGPRFITPAAAARIVRRMPKSAAAVGVFVNQEPATVQSIGIAARLDFVQLHGEESPRAAARLAWEFGVIKAIRVRPGFRVERLAGYSDLCAILLDAYDAKQRGGTGRRFDWRIAAKARRYGFLFLAGGLTPENVGEAIRAVRPYAVDVASGVEARPGKKDHRRLREFFREVAAADRSLVSMQ
jgi:phosphoribosylanthranilate isomerase